MPSATKCWSFEPTNSVWVCEISTLEACGGVTDQQSDCGGYVELHDGRKVAFNLFGREMDQTQEDIVGWRYKNGLTQHLIIND